MSKFDQFLETEFIPHSQGHKMISLEQVSNAPPTEIVSNAPSETQVFLADLAVKMNKSPEDIVKYD